MDICNIDDLISSEVIVIRVQYAKENELVCNGDSVRRACCRVIVQLPGESLIVSRMDDTSKHSATSVARVMRFGDMIIRLVG